MTPIASQLAAILAPSPAREAALAAVARDTGRLLVSLLRLREIDAEDRSVLEDIVRQAAYAALDPSAPDDDADEVDVRDTYARDLPPAAPVMAAPPPPAAEAEPPKQATPNVARGDAPMSPPPAPGADLFPDMAGKPTAAGRLAHLKTATSAEQAESARLWPDYGLHRRTLEDEVIRMMETHRQIEAMESARDIAGLIELGAATTTQRRPGLVQHLAAALERLRQSASPVPSAPVVEESPTMPESAPAVEEAPELAPPADPEPLDLDDIEAPV